MDALNVVGQAQTEFGNALKGKALLEYNPRVFLGTDIKSVPEDLQNIPRLVQTAKKDLEQLQAIVAEAQKLAKNRWRCRKRRLFGILANVFNYSACALGVGAFVSLFTGPGALAAPVLAAAAAMASAAATACTALQGPSSCACPREADPHVNRFP